MKDFIVLSALILAVGSLCAVSRGEDEPAVTAPQPGSPAQPSGMVPTPAASMPASGRPRGLPPGAVPVAADAPASFVTEEKWGMAGYNSNEPIFTILITSHDPRIIRCTADLKGTYIENGAKFPVTDRQTTTVFPNAQVQIGNWSGMDQQSGAVYAVKCRPI